MRGCNASNFSSKSASWRAAASTNFALSDAVKEIIAMAGGNVVNLVLRQVVDAGQIGRAHV
jgi:hypothetical protein